LSNRSVRYETRISPSKLALGAGRLGAFWQGHSSRESARTLSAALDAGIRLIDTADVYALGLSERVIGRVLRQRRAETLLCTKLGQLKTPLSTLAAHRASGSLSLASLRAAIPRRTPVDPTHVPRCFDSAYLRWALGRSLTRLRSPRVDILLLHGPTQLDLAARLFEPAITRALRDGDAAHFGVSCDDADVALAAAELPYVSFIELPVDVGHPAERAIVARLAASGIGVLARSPFARGELIARVTRELGLFDEESAAYCLQAVTEFPDVFTTIVGMHSPARVHENVRLLSLPISPRRRAEIERALARPSSSEAFSAGPTTSSR
jgi:aryl-alcohol dehydrogenase-like predicted oxidoreductase